MRLFFVFPISGPNNGVKVISNFIRNSLSLEKNLEMITVDTSQAKDYSNFGKFSFNKVFFLIKVLKKLFNIQKSDYVYLNLTPKGFAFYRDLLVLFICFSKTPNITIHIHANDLEKKIKWYNKRLFSKAKIIVINQNQKKRLQTLSGKCYLLPNALPDYYHAKSICPNINDKINLIFLSNLSKEKGINRIEKLAKLIKDKKLHCIINVYGGTLTIEDKNLINNLNSNYKSIIYHGPLLNEDDKFSALQQNDALLFLSDENYEVSPLVYIEALMSGLFILTTKQVVAKNLLDLNVAMTLDKDLDNFEEIFYELLNKKRDLKTNIRSVYLDNYSFKEYIRNLKNIIIDA